jgi:hypothetical protein
MKKLAVVSIVFLFACYFGLAASPLKDEIGRSHPRIAAALSPITFNFNAVYDSGRVLNFEVGMNREQVGRALTEHAGRAVLLVSCGNRFGNLHDENLVRVAADEDLICLWFSPISVNVTLRMAEDRLSSIEMNVVNLEAT